MNPFQISARCAGAFFLLLGSIPAQGGNPMDEIKEIFRRVEKEMAEIDQLLLNSSTERAAAKMAEVKEELQKLLEQAKQKQGSVIKGIQEILDKAPQSGKSGGGRQDPKQQKPQQRPEPRDQNDRDGEREPNEGQRNPPSPGENKPANKQPPESATGTVDRSELDKQWGNLPEYLRALHSVKGGPPVPAKYRRFFEEFIRQNAKVRK
jgi:hypothetical protein